jgi:hypothetical protein
MSPPTDDLDWSSVQVSMTDAQTQQFVTLYQALQDFDDHAGQPQIICPRLCFAGSADEIAYGERWGNVRVRIAGPLVDRRAALRSLSFMSCQTAGRDDASCGLLRGRGNAGKPAL